MDEVKSKKSKIMHQDRVGLDQDCLKKIDGWIEQVLRSGKGVVLSRKDMVNWLINWGLYRIADILSSNGFMTRF